MVRLRSWRAACGAALAALCGLSTVASGQDETAKAAVPVARAAYPGTADRSPVQQPAAGAQPAGTPAAGPPLVSNVFFETDIKQVLADIASQTKTVIIPDETVQGLLTIELKDMPLERALRLVLLPGGYAYTMVEPGVYLVLSPDPQGPNFQRIAKTQVVDLNYLKGEDLKLQLPEVYAKFVKYDDLGNRVVVTAPQETLDAAVAQIKALDVPPLQVMIEALVVETTGGLADEFYAQVEGGKGQGDTATGLFAYVEDASSLLVRVMALVTKDRGSIKATPRVVTQEGRKANFRVSVNQYFSLVSGRLGFEFVRLEAIEAAVGLIITPQVAEQDRKITCTIEPEVGDVTGVGEDNLPIITKRTAQTTVRVEDGQIIAIGGLLQEVVREIHRKVPILGDIPLLGELFKSKRDTKEQRELTIFIVPHILNEDGSFAGQLLSERIRPELAKLGPRTPSGAATEPTPPVAPVEPQNPALRR